MLEPVLLPVQVFPFEFTLVFKLSVGQCVCVVGLAQPVSYKLLWQRQRGASTDSLTDTNQTRDTLIPFCVTSLKPARRTRSLATTVASHVTSGSARAVG